MPVLFHCHIAEGAAALRRPILRYGLLRRLFKCAERRDVRVLAFGLGDHELRVVLEGPDDLLRNVLRGTKSGTCREARSWGDVMYWGATERHEVPAEGLAEAIASCHRVDDTVPALANPWTSHRDLMGYREARFFDAETARARVDPLEVHRLAKGGALPTEAGLPTSDAALQDILRVSAAVVGVLPANRRCFRLFVHVARTMGFQTAELARALMLTGRRIRQLSQGQEPLLDVAMAHLSDARLCEVP